MLLLAGFLFLSLSSPSPAQADKAATAAKPLKVFILAGQSNMQGHANVATFDSLADDPRTAPLLKDMRDKDGKPKVCDRV
jgi:alpha-galactosidase